MLKGKVLIQVDGRDVVVSRAALVGRVVLAAVGAHPKRGDLLFRDEGGSSRLVPSDEPIFIGEGILATFRVCRGGVCPNDLFVGQIGNRNTEPLPSGIGSGR